MEGQKSIPPNKKKNSPLTSYQLFHTDATPQPTSQFFEEESPTTDEEVENIFDYDFRGEKITESSLRLYEMDRKNWQNVKFLNTVALPLRYEDRFYAQYLKNSGDRPELPSYWTKLAYYEGGLCGALCCRIERFQADDGLYWRRVNLQTFACMPVYRRRGIGSILMCKLIEYCKNQNSNCTLQENPENENIDGRLVGIKSIYLHCQVTNEVAIKFYDKFDFKEVERLDNYYHRVDSSQAKHYTMSASSGPYGRVVPVSPPLKGSFPLDYGRECHVEMLDYMWCLHEKKFKNEECRNIARTYFKCRMDRGLMDRNEWKKLGYKDE